MYLQFSKYSAFSIEGNVPFVHDSSVQMDVFNSRSGDVKGSSQASWLASQSKNKRPDNHSKISYGKKTKQPSRIRLV